ncbi:hypothetical protein [uncultured Gammaproteobacteria bacterium]|nr:hypothetical protein [uncultured Gammaproteobacteria bacterium]
MVKWLSVLAVCYSSLSTASNEFSAFFNSFESLSANFSQQTYSNTGAVLANTSGSLKFKRPAQFIWQTDLPFEQTLLLTDNELWLVDHELEQASMRPTEALKNTPLYWLINRPDQLDTLPSFTDSQQGVRWYSTQQDDTLSFGFVDKKLAAIKLNNRLDQKILVSFSKLKINPIFKQNTFKLTLGADFDVIR